MTAVAPPIERIDTEQQAIDLARRLNSGIRDRPVVVVTVPARTDRPFIDVERIADEVGDAVDIVLMPTGDPSRSFADEMPDGTQVYGGAGRVYPVGVEWVSDLKSSPLRMAFNAQQGERVTATLITDALHMAVAAGLLGRSASVAENTFEGTVTGTIAGRAIVQNDSGKSATIVPELIVEGVEIDDLVQPGMKVAGTLDGGGRLDVRASLCAPSAVLYQPGQVVLARVDAVDESSAVLTLHPSLSVPVEHDQVSPNELDRLDQLMTEGEVLRARVTATSPWALRLDDIDDDEIAAPALSLLPGGPSWLREGLPSIPEDELVQAPDPRVLDPAWDASAVAAERPAPKPEDLAVDEAVVEETVPKPIPTAPRTDQFGASLKQALDAANEKLRTHQRTIEALHGELDGVVAELESSRRRNDELKRDLAKRTQELRKSRVAPPSPEGDLFEDSVDQFNHEVYVAWARRIPRGDKADKRLCAYSLGPRFLDSVDRLEGISRSKIVDVVVEVLAGIAEQQPGRALHPLRQALSAATPQRERSDGAKAWRVALQQGASSARRLHFWRCPDGSVELAKVVTHNDFTI